MRNRGRAPRRENDARRARAPQRRATRARDASKRSTRVRDATGTRIASEARFIREANFSIKLNSETIGDAAPRCRRWSARSSARER
jgi:hypothetical protein